MDVGSTILLDALRKCAGKALDWLFSDVGRAAVIKYAFRRDLRLESRTVLAASRDLERALGTEGRLTTKMAELLSDLANTGLLPEMIQAAVAETPAEGCRSAFAVMFENHFGPKATVSGLDAGKLYDKISLTLRNSIVRQPEGAETKELVKKMLSTLKQQAALLDKLTRPRFSGRRPDGTPFTLDELRTHSPWLFQDAESIHSLIRSLADAMIPHFHKIRVEGPSEKTIPIAADDLFVEPLLQPVKFDPLKPNEFSTVGSQVPFSQFESKFSRAVIVGDPGGGKSTAVQMICLNILRQASNGELVFPIIVTLRKFAAASTSSLLDFIISDTARKTNFETPENLRLPIRHLLTFGHAIVIFDGLDEIVDVSKRREVLLSIQQFCSLYSFSRFVVTSRKVGYGRAALTEFPTYELSPFDDGRMEEYFRKSAQNIFAKQPDAIDEDYEKFCAEAQRSASEFIYNPLLLSLITWLFNASNRIPDNRAKVYDECATLLFQRWDSLRDIWPDVPTPHRLFNLLPCLAAEMYLNPELQGGASRAQLLSIIKNYFISDYSDNAEARATDAAIKFADHLSTGRAWVLRAVGDNVWEFTHRTFMEYFFALHLKDTSRSVDDLFDKLEPHILNSEWNVPAHLAIQLWVHGLRQQAQYAVDRLLMLYHKTPPVRRDEIEMKGDPRSAVLYFIAQATEYLMPAEPALERLSRLITAEVPNTRQWHSAFVSVLQTPNEMRRSIFRGMGNGIADLIEQGRLDRVAVTLDWLKALEVWNGPGIMSRPPIRLASVVECLHNFTGEFIEPLRTLEHSQAAAAKARFELCHSTETTAISEFGMRLWQASSEGPLYRVDWRALDFARMVFEFELLASGKSGLEQLPYARLAIELPKAGYKLFPLPMSHGAVMTVGRQPSRLEAINTARSFSPEQFVGLVYALIAHAELSKWYSPFMESPRLFALVASTYEHCRSDMVDFEADRDFFDAWMGGSSQMFHGSLVQRVTMPIERMAMM